MFVVRVSHVQAALVEEAAVRSDRQGHHVQLDVRPSRRVVQAGSAIKIV